MEFFNSLNLTQIKGGTKLKQGDLGSVLSYSLTDENGQEITSFDNKTAYINLVLDDKIWFTTTTLVDISRVTFRIDKAIPIGLYYLEIKIDDYIFPSDRDSIILIEEGSTPYDLKELVPNYDINMTLKGILSDLSQKGIDISDLNRRIGNANAELIAARNGKSNLKTRIDDLENKTTEQLAQKANKDEVTNVMTPKGNIAYASLPTSGNQVGWYYYCPDGDGTHGAGNYVWNGSSWFFGGTGDEGYNLLKGDLDDMSIVIKSTNLLNPNTMIEKSYVNDIGQVIVNGGNNIVSDFIDVESNEKYFLTTDGRGNNFKNLSEYDKDGNFIKNTPYADSPYTMGQNTKKIRITINFSNGGTKDKVVDGKWCFCKSDIATPYVPYYKYYRALVTDENTPLDFLELRNLCKIKNKYRYLATTFIASTDGNNNMILLGTNNLKDFHLLSKRGENFSSLKNDSVRDPSIIQIDDYYYIVYTTISFGEGNEIGFCRTKDFTNYEELENLPVLYDIDTSVIFRNVWAPAWFRDGNDIYIISSCRKYGDNQGFSTVVNKYNVETHTIDVGSVIRIGGYIDAHIYKENDNYYAFCGGKKVYKSTSLLGTYTQLTDYNEPSGHYEADYVVKLDNGKWRHFMQEVNDGVDTNSSHMCYVDMDTLESDWSDVKQVNYDSDALTYAKSFSGQAVAEYWHWTIFDFNNANGNNNNFI